MRQRDHGGHGVHRPRSFKPTIGNIVTYRCSVGCVGFWKEPLRALDRVAVPRCPKCGAIGHETAASTKRRTPVAPKVTRREQARITEEGHPFVCECAKRFRSGVGLKLHLSDTRHHAMPPRECDFVLWENQGLHGPGGFTIKVVGDDRF